MKTAVVILNWNTADFLRRFLPGLLASVRRVPDCEVIVADNASADDSMKVMTEEFPDVRTLVFKRNLGFTGGYNEAFRLICQGDDSPEYFLLINSDIEVPEDWLQPLVQWMDTHPECGACAPKLHSWFSRNTFEYAGAAGGFLDRYGYPFCRGRVLKRIEEDNGQYDAPADVLWATGACLMVRSSVFRQMGGLDDRFFAHMEEIDLCWRMQLAGWRVTIVPESTVYHVGGGTLPQSSPFKLFLNYRNNLLMLSNNLSKTYALKHHREGKDIHKAAHKGLREARLTISVRMMLDMMSAGIYLLTFDWKSLKSVLKAHKEYRRLKSSPDAGEVERFLDRYGQKASVKGMYSKWIISEAVIRGSRIFDSIKSEDFQCI